MFHIIGIVSIFIASKYEDVNYLRLNTVQKKIGHSKFPKEMLVSCEMEILRGIGFRIPSRTPIEDINIQWQKENTLCDDKE
jgi:hypothetical protein